MNFNQEQLKAITHKDGPLLIIAGAGTGKTGVITNRIINLVEEQKVAPYKILAITFTNKAANEMKERIAAQLECYKDIQISTFHSLCALILRYEITALNYKSNFTILDTNDGVSMIKKILRQMNLDAKDYIPKVILSTISKSKNANISYVEYKKNTQNIYEEIIGKIFEQYEKNLFSNNALDFDDLLIKTLELFEIPEILEKYQNKYHYVHVDEYQDTNQIQYLLVQKLVAKHHNICVVGDNDQSIYGFRGADIRNIMNFEEDFPNALVIMLEENYRSTKNILQAANNVIKNNRSRKDKNLWSSKEEGSLIKFVNLENEKKEADFVLEQILKENKENYNEIAILYRINALSRNFEERFIQNNIPYKITGALNFYARKEIKDVIAYMRLISNKADDISLLRIINVPKRKIGQESINKLTSIAEKNNISLFDAIDILNNKHMVLFKQLILSLDAINLSIKETLNLVIEETGYKNMLLNEKNIDIDGRYENVMELLSVATAYDQNNDEPTLDGFLIEISLVSDISFDENQEYINLMTIHSAKGLEFDKVFIVGFEEGIFPSNIEEGNIEEERRLAYVAITRARKDLYITSSKIRNHYGKEVLQIPSRFIKEIGMKLLETLNSRSEARTLKKVEPRNNLKNNFLEKKNEVQNIYEINDVVHHRRYGEGVVLNLIEDSIEIAFAEEFGVKEILMSFEGLRKLS